MLIPGYSTFNESKGVLTDASQIRVGDIVKDDDEYYEIIGVQRKSDHVELTTLTNMGKRGLLSLNYGSYDRCQVFDKDDFYWTAKFTMVFRNDDNMRGIVKCKGFQSRDAKLEFEKFKKSESKKYGKQRVAFYDVTFKFLDL